MKADVLSIQAEKIKSIDLPEHFSEEIRPDLIRQVFLVQQANQRQPYGAAPEAGQRAAAKLSRRRRDFKSAYGKGIARTPRKTLSRRGSQFTWVGAVAPNTVSGRRAHPPKASKIWNLDINKKEKRKAIRSAIASTLNKDLLQQRGFSAFNTLPLIIEDKFESIQKTKDALTLLKKLGLEKEIERVAEKSIKSGKGKSRGNKYKRKKGPLVVVSKNCPLQKAIKNIQGFETCTVNKLNTKALAPGAQPGRLVIWSLPSIEKLKTLFT